MGGRIPQPFIQDLLARTDIVETISPRIVLKKQGSNYSARCPFHEEKTPSFSVSQTKQFYYCFGCGAHGNAIDFLMHYDRLDFVSAIEMLASQVGLEVQREGGDTQANTHSELYPLLGKVAEYYQQQLPPSKIAIDYLKSRGLTGQCAKQFHIGFAPAGWNNLSRHFHASSKITQQLINAGMMIAKETSHPYDRFRQRIMFPIRDIRGRIIGFGGRALGDEQPKYLNSPETPIFHKSQELYGLYEARQKNSKLSRLIVVEGYMDVISLAQYGIHYACATLGTAINPKHIQKLLRYTSDLIFCFDGDAAGKAAAWKALTLALPLLREGIQMRFLFLRENEDPDSLIRKIGARAFETEIDKALPLPDVFFNHLRNQYPQNTTANKAAFAKEAYEYLNTMPQGLYQQLLLKQLSQTISLSPSDLDTLIQHAPKARQPSAQILESATTKTKLNPAEIACALLLRSPSLVSEVKDVTILSTIKIRGINILITLFQRLKQSPQLTIGQLIAQAQTEAEQMAIAKLAAYPLPIPEEGFKLEFLGALDQLCARQTDQQINQLIEKAKQTVLSSAEKQRLQTLLQNKVQNRAATIDL